MLRLLELPDYHVVGFWPTHEGKVRERDTEWCSGTRLAPKGMRCRAQDDPVPVRNALFQRGQPKTSGLMKGKATPACRNTSADTVMLADVFRRTSFSGSQRIKHPAKTAGKLNICSDVL